MPEVIINGPEGRIEGRYHHSSRPNAPLALMLHPHPQHGGTMHNKVVYHLFNIFARRGFSTLRFNFRGVGRSQGTYSRGEDELSDAAAALDWMQSVNPDAPGAWVDGFSFDARIGMPLLMRRTEISGLLSVAPPASMSVFRFLATGPASGLFIDGDAYENGTSANVKKLIEKIRSQKDITIDMTSMPGAGFHIIDNLA